MTTPTTAPAYAPHDAGYAIFVQVIAVLASAGWTRQRVDTLAREDHDWQVRHQFSAGCWELHFERGPDYQRTRGGTLPVGAPSRVAKIDLRRPPLPTAEQVISHLFGPNIHLARPRPSSNGQEKV